MNNINLIYKIIKYKFSRFGLIRTPKPFILTFSVTNKCQSRCKTCYIWELYNKNPNLSKNELNLEEIEKIFKSIGKIYFFNISGGEPYLRKDLPKIIELACRYLKPNVIHIPTNGLSPELIEKQTSEILKILNKKIPITIKPSFDGIGKKYDEVRGTKDGFTRVLKTLDILKRLQKDNPNLYIGLGTVISKFNIKDIEEITNYVNNLNVDSYINEIAEKRCELFTEEKDITPSLEDYSKTIRFFYNKPKNKRGLTKITDAFRNIYYGLVIQILKEKKQVIPCYAGISNVHIDPYGNMWPCCILASTKSFGNLRDVDYNFKILWNSKKAKKIRRSIKNKECYCPMANQAYSNILCNFRIMFRLIKNFI